MRPRKADRHLPACVFHRHGAYYLVKKGKWTRIGKTEQAALAEYARRRGLAEDSLTGGGGMQQLIEDALPYVMKGKALNTQKQYQFAARKLQTILAEYSPEAVSQAVIYKVQRMLSDTPNMANRCMSVLRLVFTYAVKSDIIPSNPCVGVLRLKEKERDRLLEQDEYDRISAVAPIRLQLMMDIAFMTGQRLMDVVQIRRSDLKEEGIEFTQEKTGAKLTVRWIPELRAAVDRAKELQGDVPALSLFQSRHGTAPAYKTVRDQWVRACEAAGVKDADLRDIRAMSATAAEDQGINPTALLGHTSRQMTERYLRRKRMPKVDGPTMKSA